MTTLLNIDIGAQIFLLIAGVIGFYNLLWLLRTHTAVYTTDSFYFTEFKEVTLREAPKSATVKSKNASYPDFHGDYCSASLITLSNDNYSLLFNELTKYKRITKNKPGEIIGSSELD